MNTHYDWDMDVFSAWTRQPREVVCMEPQEGIVLRVDANTDELVGYTILDFRKRYEASALEASTLPAVPPSALLPLRAQLRLIREAASVAAA